MESASEPLRPDKNGLRRCVDSPAFPKICYLISNIAELYELNLNMEEFFVNRMKLYRIFGIKVNWNLVN